MNLRTATAFLTVLLAASGCVVQGDGKPPSNAQPGDVNFTWKLGGGTCAQNPDVRSIRITIPGQRLENDGFYACDPNGIMGVRLHDFRPGSYTYTLQGLDAFDAVRFARSGSFKVDGDVNVHVELNPQDAMVDLHWNLTGNQALPNNPTCQQAGIPFMAVMIDGEFEPYYENGQLLTVKVGNEQRPVVPCHIGQSEDGLRINLPTAGVHTLELYGVDETGYAYYRHVSTVSAFAGDVAYAEYDLAWAGAPPVNAYPGDVNFTWALGGGTCAQNPEVRSIRITIPGETLENDGFYGCAPNGIMGIRLHDFRPGSYTYTVQGLDVVNAVRFARTGSFVVDGDVNVHVDLIPKDAIVDLYWNLPGNEEFPNDPTCHQAGIPYMGVMIDGQLVPYYENGKLLTVKVGDELRPVVPCQVGQSAGGLRINLPTAGVHTVELYGVDETGYAYYRYVGTLSAFPGQMAQAEFDLSWAVGAAHVDWDSYDSVRRTCEQAGVTEVAVQFQDSEGYFLYGDGYDTGDRISCTEYGAIYSFLPEGQFWVYTAGFGSGGTLRYGSNINNPPRISVQAGLFTRSNNVNAAVLRMDRL